jgi:hypothetical protein
MEDGCRCGPPLHGPEQGALLEAYRQGGLNPELVSWKHRHKDA